MADDRKMGKSTWLRPDSKSQVSLIYDGNDPLDVTAVVISTQHRQTPTRRRSPSTSARSSVRRRSATGGTTS